MAFLCRVVQWAQGLWCPGEGRHSAHRSIDHVAAWVSTVPVYEQYFSFLEEGEKMTHDLPLKPFPFLQRCFLPFTLRAAPAWSKWSRFAISFQSTYLIKVNELLI